MSIYCRYLVIRRMKRVCMTLGASTMTNVQGTQMHTKKNEDKWWFVPTSEVKKLIPDPSEERVFGKRKLFFFQM